MPDLEGEKGEYLSFAIPEAANVIRDQSFYNGAVEQLYNNLIGSQKNIPRITCEFPL